MPEESSFLAQVIAETPKNPETPPTETPIVDSPVVKNESSTPPVPPTPPVKKPRAPLPPGTILKAVGAIFFTALIFFASFLAYIVFNPNEAQFFVTMFNIDPNDVANILRKFINGSFGIIILMLSIFWIIALFRAFWTPREQKRKKTLSIMLAVIIGVILFSVLAFWGFLFRKIGEIVWDGGYISVYDNALYDDPEGQKLSQLNSTQNLIGPINLRYDIRSNAKSLEANGIMKIDHYEMNFDGAKCSGGTSIVTGDDPKNDQGIICTFDATKTYNIRGTYFGTDVSGQVKEVSMDLGTVKIGGVVSINEQKNINDRDIVTIDASSLKLLGEPTWTYVGGNQEKKNTITVEPSATPLFVQLSIGSLMDRVFLIKKDGTVEQSGEIQLFQSPENPKMYTFTLTGTNLDENTILKIEWADEQGHFICRESKMTCENTFVDYGAHEVRANIFLTNNETLVVKKSFWIDTPIQLARHVIVTNNKGEMLNPLSTYDNVRGTFVLNNINPPDTITLDARDIVPENAGYTIKEIRWQFSDGKSNSEKIGEKISFDIVNNYRYTIVGNYTFERQGPNGTIDTKVARDAIIIDVSHQSLIPKFTIIKNSDYVPVSVTVDGSQSWSEKNDIVKFTYSFGEGKPDAVGDAVQTYYYTTSGNKEITLKIVDSVGQEATLRQSLVLKDAPRTLNFAPSLSSGIVGTPIDFTVGDALGQIESYMWNFGDNTPLQHGPMATHTFKNAGTYSITLTATYADGTQKQANMQYSVTLPE